MFRESDEMLIGGGGGGRKGVTKDEVAFHPEGSR